MIYLKITEWDGFVTTPMPLVNINNISGQLLLRTLSNKFDEYNGLESDTTSQFLH